MSATTFRRGQRVYWPNCVFAEWGTVTRVRGTATTPLLTVRLDDGTVVRLIPSDLAPGSP